MKYCRIKLSETNYTKLEDIIVFVNPPVEKLQGIYREYCEYKKFESVMPIFDSQFRDSKNTVFGYCDNRELVAFSILREYDQKNVEALQFAWNYHSPDLRLGIRSLENECAIYKGMGFDYLYLGEATDYKSEFDGYEILGKLA
jgi:hypothetical protein